MARPEKNNVDYFPFFCKEGKSMFYIEQKYGNDGFATWVKILRELAVTDFHYLNLSDEINMMYLSAKCRVDKSVLEIIINDLVKLGQFDAELWELYQVIFSEKFVDSIADAYKKRNNSVICKKALLLLLQGKSIRKLDKSIRKLDKCTSEVDGNTQSKVNKSKVIKKINKKKEETGDGLSRNTPTTKQLYPDVDFDCEEGYKPILQEWFDYKRAKKQNYTPKGRLLFYRKLVELSEDNTVTAQKIIDQSIAAPWTGIYPLITDKKNAPARNNEAGTRNTSNKRIDYSKIKVQKISEL